MVQVPVSQKLPESQSSSMLHDSPSLQAEQPHTRFASSAQFPPASWVPQVAQASHVPELQNEMPASQSSSMLHASPSGHIVQVHLSSTASISHLPPDSQLPHVGQTAQVPGEPPRQRLPSSSQSSSCRHTPPSAQPAHTGPPQSTSVSSVTLDLTPSSHWHGSGVNADGSGGPMTSDSNQCATPSSVAATDAEQGPASPSAQPSGCVVVTWPMPLM
mmetsp:Transcript_12077/g.42343  ORF Transcript_12077/g.42343 Transcript_12077/m.42343 type:complete len:216 (-) Transcript_12077:204-851(-)